MSGGGNRRIGYTIAMSVGGFKIRDEKFACYEGSRKIIDSGLYL